MASHESLLVNVDKSVTSKGNMGKEKLVQAIRKGYFGWLKQKMELDKLTKWC